MFNFVCAAVAGGVHLMFASLDLTLLEDVPNVTVAVMLKTQPNVDRFPSW
jgi:hypothetical protein